MTETYNAPVEILIGEDEEPAEIAGKARAGAALIGRLVRHRYSDVVGIIIGTNTIDGRGEIFVEWFGGRQAEFSFADCFITLSPDQ